MDRSIELFLQLLSGAIHDRRCTIKELPAESEWELLYKYSSSQNVLPMIYDQLAKSGLWKMAADRIPVTDRENPEYEQLEIALKFRKLFEQQALSLFMTQVNRTETFYSDYQDMKKAGFFPVIVKGIICRNSYPNPEQRPSGDEDLLITEEEYPAFKQHLLERGFYLVNEEQDTEMVEAAEFRHPGTGAFYEVHVRLMPLTSEYYRQFNRVFENAFEQTGLIDINGHTIRILDHTLHLFFLFCHFLKHFIAGGVGIRQLCDIVLYSKKYCDEISWSRIDGWIQTYKLEKLWMSIIKFSEEYLGCEWNHKTLPAFEVKPAEPLNMLTDMLEGGAFGTLDQERVHSNRMTVKAAESGRPDPVGGMIKSLFPGMDHMKKSYPILDSRPFLLPIMYGDRVIKYIRKKKRNPHRSGKLSPVAVGNQRIQLLSEYGVISE